MNLDPIAVNIVARHTARRALCAMDVVLAEDISYALDAARQAAFEEAAKIAETPDTVRIPLEVAEDNTRAPHETWFVAGCDAMCKTIVTALRAQANQATP